MKSQITIFMLIGIVLLVGFGFLFYIGNTVAKMQMQKNLNKVIGDVVSTSAINYYVTLCLDQAAKNATKTIGENGGVIYCKDQYDNADEARDVDLSQYYTELHPEVNCIAEVDAKRIINPDTNDFYTYGIYSDSTYLSPPDYPLILPSLIFSDEFLKDATTYYLSAVSLKPLCDQFGPNKPTPPSPYPPPPCKGPVGVYGPDSTQKQMADYISFLVANCVTAKGTFEEDLGHKIEPGEIKTNITFGDNDIQFNINYPITIYIRGSKPVIKMLDFRTSLPIRLKNIGEFALRLANRDSQKIFFNIIAESGNPNLGWKPGLRAERIMGISDADLIKITDLLDSSPYELKFLIQNRPPALNCLRDILLCQTAASSPGYDIAVLAGQTIKLPLFDISLTKPYAKDPDEDAVTFSYGTQDAGWREYYDEQLTSNCCITPENPGGSDCTDIDKLKNCIQIIDWTSYDSSDPYNNKWTDTDDYDPVTSPSTSILTDDNDIGIHTIRVAVTDEHGLSDYKDVRIFVVDGPEANLGNSDNDYSDIPNNLASIEDPYTLDASSSISQTCNLQYHYEDDGGMDSGFFEYPEFTDPSSSEYWTTEPTATIPRIYNIENMIGKQFENTGMHTITLEIKTTSPCDSIDQSLINPATLSVNVYACLPHLDASPESGVQYSAPYPYSNYAGDDYFTPTIGTTTYDYGTTPSNDFQATHVCCNGDPQYGSVKDSSQQCYKLDYITCFPKSPSQQQPPLGMAVLDSGATITTSFNPSNIADPALKNDIWHRTLTQSCSGSRGNICGGNLIDAWTRETSCADKTGTEDESCEGPPIPDTTDTCPFDAFGNIYQYSSTACTKYAPWHSFEKDFLKTGNGVCNENIKCAPGNGQQYSSTGPKLCQATCSNGGCNYAINCHCDTSCPGALCSEGAAPELDDINDLCLTSCKNDCTWNSVSCPHQNECISNCPNFGTCYYDPETPNSRNNDCTPSGCQIRTSIMDIGYICGDMGANCDNTECSQDCQNSGFISGSCSSNKCVCS